jgi:hypothetical protein
MRYTLSLTGNIILESKGLANAYFGRSKVIRERFEELPIQAHPSTRQIHHEQIASTRNTQRRRQAQAIRIRCCRMHHPVEVAVPNIFKEPLVIRVEGRDETDRFVWQGMPVLRDAKGLFALRFNRDSDLVERFFEPAATASKKLEVMGWTPPQTASMCQDGVVGQSVEWSSPQLFSAEMPHEYADSIADRFLNSYRHSHCRIGYRNSAQPFPQSLTGFAGFRLPQGHALWRVGATIVLEGRYPHHSRNRPREEPSPDPESAGTAAGRPEAGPQDRRDDSARPCD